MIFADKIRSYVFYNPFFIVLYLRSIVAASAIRKYGTNPKGGPILYSNRQTDAASPRPPFACSSFRFITAATSCVHFSVTSQCNKIIYIIAKSALFFKTGIKKPPSPI